MDLIQSTEKLIEKILNVITLILSRLQAFFGREYWQTVLLDVLRYNGKTALNQLQFLAGLTGVLAKHPSVI